MDNQTPEIQTSVTVGLVRKRGRPPGTKTGMSRAEYLHNYYETHKAAQKMLKINSLSPTSNHCHICDRTYACLRTHYNSKIHQIKQQNFELRNQTL